jgi:hypothetical protein
MQYLAFGIISFTIFSLLLLIGLNYSYYSWQEKTGEQKSDIKKSFIDSIRKGDSSAYSRAIVSMTSSDKPKWLALTIIKFEKFRKNTWKFALDAMEYLVSLSRPEYENEYTKFKEEEKEQKNSEILDKISSINQKKEATRYSQEDEFESIIESYQNQNRSGKSFDQESPRENPKPAFKESSRSSVNSDFDEEKRKGYISNSLSYYPEHNLEDEDLEYDPRNYPKNQKYNSDEETEYGMRPAKKSQATIDLLSDGSEEAQNNKFYQAESRILKKIREHNLEDYSLWFELSMVYAHIDIEKQKEVLRFIMKNAKNDQEKYAKMAADKMIEIG